MFAVDGTATRSSGSAWPFSSDARAVARIKKTAVSLLRFIQVQVGGVTAPTCEKFFSFSALSDQSISQKFFRLKLPCQKARKSHRAFDQHPQHAPNQLDLNFVLFAPPRR